MQKHPPSPKKSASVSQREPNISHSPMTLSKIEIQCFIWLKFALMAVLLPEKAQTLHFPILSKAIKLLKLFIFDIFDKKE